MQIKKYQCCLAFYMLIVPTLAVVFKESKDYGYLHDGRFYKRMPIEESIWRGENEPYAEIAGQLWAFERGHTETLNRHTITAITPDIVISCAHGFHNWVRENGEKTRAIFYIDRTIHSSSIKNFYICPGFSSSDSRDFNKEKDIAIIKLATPIPFENFMPFYSITETSISQKKQDIVCISTGKIHHSREDEIVIDARHVTTPQITYNSDTFNFREEFHVHHDYQPYPIKQSSPYWTPLPTLFKPKKSAPTGLQGPFTPGDSGSPLLISHQDKYHLLGIATHIEKKPAYDDKTKQYIPGQSFYNNWASIPYNLPWITSILKQENALSYHPELLAATL
ncbi:hypothetical protein [Candidatus Odyssella acanthamoebae]|uniref:Peptidase S1 domain-containing protein n=1 Tax=Candidatus Odyssella acanthamoebae TaxID=91604 RepID=A0A077AXF5_9PROT|nr:hypothetical protein [Candidatus Paracaedibacter acanthamoebae]AIK97276.1 hypothetical protein ID47_11845 [Candidatus Paracaedibacter acanthamoebae]